MPIGKTARVQEVFKKVCSINTHRGIDPHKEQKLAPFGSQRDLEYNINFPKSSIVGKIATFPKTSFKNYPKK